MSELSDAAVAELVARYSRKVKQNPAWDRKAERQAWREARDYDVPEFIDRTPEEMAADGCWTEFTGADGHLSLRALTYQEVAAVAEDIETSRLANLTGERDRARDAAVALEKECARLREALQTVHGLPRVGWLVRQVAREALEAGGE